MNCPACNNQLKEMKVSDIVVDVCEGGCAGIWFDNFELKKVDEKHEVNGESLLAINKNSDVAVDHQAKRQCPKCPDITMRQNFFSTKKDVEVDECGNCGGMWLDAGELRKIRNLYQSEDERKKAAHAYFDEVFGGELDAAKAKSQADLEKKKRIANAFRLICPSYYIPGKQDWGAF